MSLRVTFTVIGLGLAALVLSLVVVISLQVRNAQLLEDAEASEDESLALADRLQQSSDDLTRMARAYVVTGDPQFETYFKRILGIRNGLEPRPAKYGREYWDMVTATGKEPDEFVKPIALRTLMLNAHFSREELAKLDESQQLSDDLARIENRAMAAVKGLYADEDGEYTRKGEPDLKLAQGLMFGKDYYDAKARILRPIAEFREMANDRTHTRVIALRQSDTRMKFASLAIAAVSLGFIGAGALVIRRRISRPLRNLVHGAQRIEAGEHPTLDEGRADELGLLTRAFNQMSASIHRDIERREKADADLKRINFLADIALELTGCGYWHVDYSDPDYYYQSERAAKILGEAPKADGRYHLQNEWFARLLEADPECAKKTSERYQGAIEGRYPNYESTYAYKRPADGRIIWLHALGKVVRDDTGRIRYMYGAYQEVTQRVNNEAALHDMMEKVQAATKAKSAFLANMSHEIRTPMNGIMGMTELALDTNLTAEQRDYLNTVKSSADALLSLINDILDFSKIEAGRIELDSIDFLLRDSMGDTLGPLALRAAAKHVELAYEVHPDVPDALIGDVYRLRQVIVNLVGNAIKFTERGEVVLSMHVLERSEKDVLLEVVVRDTGIGIAPEAAARLFKAFEQAEASTTRKYGGTGLGLAISKQLVELMGGQIRLESAPGVGSRFIFTVRMGVGVARPSTSADDAARVLTGKTALIVDDNETNLRILSTILSHWGLNTISADRGAAAMTALDRARNAGQAIALVITDLHMPEMDGFELTRLIRAHPGYSTVPVMLLTSSASSGDSAKCEELGVAARLLKPVKQSLLLDNIMRVLGGADRSRAASAPVKISDSGATAERKSLRVLLAEDNPVNQKFAVRVLEGAGHAVVIANNGVEAVAHAGSQVFDIVLMDVQMPEMDGLDATRAIRTREADGSTRLPIIAMTANAMQGDREMCMNAGMDGYVPKPVKRDVLFAEIDRVLKETARGKDL